MHFFLPVNRNRIRFVVAVRLRVIVKVDLQWRARHGGDRMMRTFVECRFAELLDEPFLHLLVVFRRTGEWELSYFWHFFPTRSAFM